MRRLFEIATVFMIAAAPCFAEESATTTAIIHTTIVDVERGALERDRSVLIRGERIARIGPATENQPPEGAQIVDGKGTYIIPGLFDAHVHLIDSGTYLPARRYSPHKGHIRSCTARAILRSRPA
jgi:cytosine/adenosine deaminase-related metal-dependent hydrolase